MTTSIQVYATNIRIESENEQSNVTLSGIDPSQVLGEFSVEERLESIDFEDLVAYVEQEQQIETAELYRDLADEAFGTSVSESLDNLTIRRTNHA